MCSFDIYPVNINGNLVSADNRNRLFWTNIKYTQDLFGNKYTSIPQPDDKKIYLSDILEYGYTDLIKAMGLRTKHSIQKDPIKTKRRYESMGMDSIIFNSPDFDYNKGYRCFNKNELEILHNIPKGYTRNLTLNQAWNLIGDGWTVDVI